MHSSLSHSHTEVNFYFNFYHKEEFNESVKPFRNQVQACTSLSGRKMLNMKAFDNTLNYGVFFPLMD